MLGFSIEFKRWYIVLRGPRGRVYLATGFAKQLPFYVSPTQAAAFDVSSREAVAFYVSSREAVAFDTAADDTHSAILADEWREDDDEDEEIEN